MRLKRSGRLAPTLLALALALSSGVVACNGTEFGSADDGLVAEVGSPADPCREVTKRVAEGALGSPVGEPERATADDDAGNPVVTCVWRPTGALDPALALTVAAVTYPSESEAETALDSQEGEAGTSAVEDVGDAAFVVGAPPVVVMRTGNVVFRFDLGSQTDPERQHRLTDMAETADRRLRS